MARYKEIPEHLAELQQAKEDSSPENILAILKKYGEEKGAKVISGIMRHQQQVFRVRGILAACAYVEAYDCSSSHPFKISDCVMSKLNVTTEKPRNNVGIILSQTIERVSSKSQNLLDCLSLEPTQYSDEKYPIKLKAGNVYRITVSRIRKNKGKIK